MASGDGKAIGDGTGNGKGVSMLPGFGGKGRYGRIDADLSDDGPRRGIESKRYIFACAIFASLNSVLLGYGERKAPPLLPPLALKDPIWILFSSSFLNVEVRMVMKVSEPVFLEGTGGGDADTAT